jgi:putative oxidoreductase
MTLLRKRFDSAGLLVLRVSLGVIMTAHGLQKVQRGPAEFGRTALDSLGVPAPEVMGYVVTFVELGGGILLILGLLTRLAALGLTVDLVVALLLVKVKVGLIAEEGAGAGAELDLALIAGFLALLLMGGRPVARSAHWPRATVGWRSAMISHGSSPHRARRARESQRVGR